MNALSGHIRTVGYVYILASILIELGRKYLSPRTCAASQKSSISSGAQTAAFFLRKAAWTFRRLKAGGGALGSRVGCGSRSAAASALLSSASLMPRYSSVRSWTPSCEDRASTRSARSHIARAVVDRACGLASLTVAFVAGRIRVLAAVGHGGSLGSVVDLAHGHGLPDSESRGLVPRNRSGRPNRLGGRRVGAIVTVDLAGHVRAIDGGDTQIRGCEVTQRRVARDRRQVRGRPAQRRRRRSSGGRCVPRDPALGRGV